MPAIKPMAPLNLTRLLLMIAFLLFGVAGCEKPSPSTESGKLANDSAVSNSSVSSTPPQHQPQLTGSRILQKVVERYQSARSYSDKGVVYLTYRLQGRAIKEPHPFSTIWDKANLLSCRIFKTHIQSDSKLLSCFVYDIQTGNLDGQQLYFPIDRQLPLKELYEDGIARHYLGGYSDLPLDETNKTQLPQLIPPQLSLLTDQLSFGWIETPQAAKRLPDQSLDNRACYVVRSQFESMSADIWIDQKTDLVAQVSMPLKIMDREVLTSGEIKDVELLIRLDEATVDTPTPLDRNQFSTALKEKGTPVRRFIATPDLLPSERIGQLVPKFQLKTPDNKEVNHLHFDGRTTVLAWVGSGELKPVFDSYQALLEKSASPEIEFAIVYSESELQDPEGDSCLPNNELNSFAKAWKAKLYFDGGLQSSEKFQLKAVPAVVVIGPDSRVDYVASLSNAGWEQELKAALERIVRGENVANDMREAYQKHLDDYHQQKLTASARSLLGMPEIADAESSAKGNSPEGDSAIAWQPVLHWKNQSFKNPGNILFQDRGSNSSLLVMDGWRTVVELDLNGKEVARHKLELDEQIAVSCLRSLREPTGPTGPTGPITAKGNLAFAAFSVQGEKVYIFDQDWKLVASLPPGNFQHDGIRDVQLTTDRDGKAKVLIAFANGGGCYSIEYEQRTMTRVSKSRIDSLSVASDAVFACNAGRVAQLKEFDVSQEPDDILVFQRLFGLEIPSRNSSFFGATIADRENNWQFARVDQAGKLGWRQPIGSQLFENEIEPISGFVMSKGVGADGVIAIADAGNRVTMVSADGRFLGQFNAPAALSGIRLIEHSGSLHLLLSTKEGVSDYRLVTANVPATPASHTRDRER